ncbi:hypothetical protein FPV67DRAFT_1434682 [Lyophyllum atratum]|nr:hypothetical protein FPV67DRAFT_1434682 [Lyophyllum atratum]
MKNFLLYLRRLLPIVHDGIEAHKNSPDWALQKLATDPDYFMPFRDVAPTRSHAIATLFADKDWLLTPEGFGSALIHRAFFYGSPFSLNHSGKFNSIQEWDTIYADALASNQVSDKKQSYFVRNNVYGSASKHRRLEHLPKLWEARTEWPAFIEKHGEPTFLQLFDFLSVPHRFYGVGPLTAMLIAGDLTVAGVASMPTAEELGGVIYAVKRGAFKGLRRLGLIGESGY